MRTIAIAVGMLVAAAGCGGRIESESGVVPLPAPAPVCTVMSIGLTLDGGASLTIDHVGKDFPPCGEPVGDLVSLPDGEWLCGDRAALPDTWCCYDARRADGPTLCRAALDGAFVGGIEALASP